MFAATYFAQSYLYFASQVDTSVPAETPGGTTPGSSGNPAQPPAVTSPQLFDTPVIPTSFRVDGRTTQESLY